MPNYVITRQAMAPSGPMTICDVSGTELYRVRGQPFSYGDQLSLESSDGQEVAFIRQQLGIGLRYEISRDGIPACAVHHAIGITDLMAVEVPGEPDIEIAGHLPGLGYQLSQAGLPVAAVANRLTLGPGRYEVEIVAGSDEVLVLAIIVAAEAIRRHNPRLTGPALSSGWSSRRSQVPSGCLRATCARTPVPSLAIVAVSAMSPLISVGSGGSGSNRGAFASPFSQSLRIASRPVVWPPGG